MKIFIVIPAYQAEKTIAQVFARVPKGLWNRLAGVIVVDDGSTDRTAEIVKTMQSQWDNIRLATHAQNIGYAAAQKTGFSIALDQGADIVALLHADGQYAPELLPALLKPLEDGEADVVQGSRILGGRALTGGMPLYKYVANRTLSAIENLVTGLNLAEYHSGYMLYSRRALQTIPFRKLSNTFHFDGEMLLVAGKKKLRIKEIGIPTYYGEEKSHLRPIRYGFDVLGITLRAAMGQYDNL